MGGISIGRGGSISAYFVGYVFKVGETKYAGIFALYGDDVLLQTAHKTLAGRIIQIRFDPSSPDNSLLVNTDSATFEGLTVTQDPEWLNQAPAFDLQDTIRGS